MSVHEATDQVYVDSSVLGNAKQDNTPLGLGKAGTYWELDGAESPLKPFASWPWWLHHPRRNEIIVQSSSQSKVNLC